MNILLLLIPLSLLLLLAAIAAFVWAVRRGQFDDLDSPAIDILADEPAPERTSRDDTAAGREPPAGARSPTTADDAD
ncbi:cbb3-type cytochrome oxidase assembly protein CcoS [Lysobacteraceae bacterium NML91-0213]|nr:cbb3-type cytochrome oxidase assembly protein CcoS [Xanthomonadaceae bacterium NML91-0213]